MPGLPQPLTELHLKPWIDTNMWLCLSSTYLSCSTNLRLIKRREQRLGHRPIFYSEFNRHWSQDESFKFDKIYKNLQMQVAKSSWLSFFFLLSWVMVECQVIVYKHAQLWVLCNIIWGYPTFWFYTSLINKMGDHCLVIENVTY